MLTIGSSVPKIIVKLLFVSKWHLGLCIPNIWELCPANIGDVWFVSICRRSIAEHQFKQHNIAVFASV